MATQSLTIAVVAIYSIPTATVALVAAWSIDTCLLAWTAPAFINVCNSNNVAMQYGYYHYVKPMKISLFLTTVKSL